MESQNFSSKAATYPPLVSLTAPDPPGELASRPWEVWDPQPETISSNACIEYIQLVLKVHDSWFILL